MKNRNLHKKIAATLTAGTLLCTSQGWAAENTDFQLDQIIVTAERITQTVGATPANVTIISGAELAGKGARTLADALTGVGGIQVQNYGGTGEKAIPYIFGTDRLIVLLDGKRLNLPQGIGSGSGGIDVNTILLGDNIERIEIVRGGASVLYGADAIGGVVNIITKSGSGGAVRTTVSTAGGSDGARHYALTTGGQLNKTHWQLTGVRDTNDGQRPNSAFQGKNIAFQLDQDLNKTEALIFTYDYYDSNAGMPGSLSWPSANDFQDILRHNWSVGYRSKHAAGSRAFRYYDHKQVYSGENYGSFFRHQNTVQTFEVQDSIQVDAANLLTWGGEWRKEQVSSTAEGNTPHNGITKAVYLQHKYNFNSAAQITLAVRRDDSSIYGIHWLPKAACLYQANAHTSYFANWGKVFKAPKFDDLYGDDGYGNTGNPNLQPETGWTAEAGVKMKLNNAHEATLSYFKRDLTNAIKWQPADPGDPLSPYHPSNINHYTSTGLNASLLSKLSPAVSTDIGYTYLDSHDQNDVAVGDPRHSFHIGVKFHNGKLTQTIYGIYQDKTGTAASQVNSHFLVNTHANYLVNNDTTLFLTINNLFDKQYQFLNGYPANGRAVLFGVKQTL